MQGHGGFGLEVPGKRFKQRTAEGNARDVSDEKQKHFEMFVRACFTETDPTAGTGPHPLGLAKWQLLNVIGGLLHVMLLRDREP